MRKKPKEIKIANLKPGQKFRFNGKLFMMDKLYCVIRLSNGEVEPENMNGSTLVTPVKISIRVL